MQLWFIPWTCVVYHSPIPVDSQPIQHFCSKVIKTLITLSKTIKSFFTNSIHKDDEMVLHQKSNLFVIFCQSFRLKQVYSGVLLDLCVLNCIGNNSWYDKVITFLLVAQSFSFDASKKCQGIDVGVNLRNFWDTLSFMI